MDDYVINAPLSITSYVIDAREVHSAIRKLIMGHTEDKATIKPHEHECDRQKDWKAILRHFSREGLYAKDLIRATHILKNSYYLDEKQDVMWWTRFQTELDWAFAVYTKKYPRNGQPYHPNKVKLQILLDKVRANFLQNTKAVIKVTLSNNPNYQYNQACLAFQAEVNAKYPNGPGLKGPSC